LNAGRVLEEHGLPLEILMYLPELTNLSDQVRRRREEGGGIANCEVFCFTASMPSLAISVQAHK
jgi:hypothetical protein